MNLPMAIKGMPNDSSVIGMVVTETLGYTTRAADAGISPDNFTAITTTASFQMGITSKSDKGWATIVDTVAAAKAGENLRFGTMSRKLGIWRINGQGTGC
ncbi:hypothetical protein [Sulfitobacter sp.]|uniref:hypothetical protein n=1 Tax=Sulfitobacter sp. TaxID=1903071 RepID=UPI003001E272